MNLGERNRRRRRGEVLTYERRSSYRAAVTVPNVALTVSAGVQTGSQRPARVRAETGSNISLVHGAVSMIGAGSTFWFTLTLETAGEMQARAVLSRTALQGARVLVVDDNRTNRVILEQNLKVWGARTSSFERSQEGTASLKEAAAAGDPFPLAILDYHMPIMDGIELAYAIRSDPDITAVRMILLSSMSRPGDTRAALTRDSERC
jgi:CheY-like chemotaxis protein